MTDLLYLILAIAGVRGVHGEQIACSPTETICKATQLKYGCCSYKDGVCCADMIHCCRKGYVCNTKVLHCIPSFSLFNLSSHPMATMRKFINKNHNVTDTQHLNNIFDVLDNRKLIPVQENKKSKSAPNAIFDILKNTDDIANHTIDVLVITNSSDTSSDVLSDTNSSIYDSFTAPGTWVRAQGLEPIIVGGVGSGIVAVALILYLAVRLKSYNVNKGYQHLSDHSWVILDGSHLGRGP